MAAAKPALLQASGRLGLLLALACLGACGNDEVTQGKAPPPSATADTGMAGTQTGDEARKSAPGSDYTAPPPPLLDQPKPTRQPAAGSAADLPPIVSSIPATTPNRIDVIIRDPLPVSAARLIDPQGHEIVTPRIDHDRLSYKGGGSGWPRIGVGIMGGSNSGVSTGFGIGFPLFPQTSEAAGSVNESRFSFIIPDAAAYAGTWQHWKIHIDLSDGVNSRSFETLPPAPPRN